MPSRAHIGHRFKLLMNLQLNSMSYLRKGESQLTLTFDQHLADHHFPETQIQGAGAGQQSLDLVERL